MERESFKLVPFFFLKLSVFSVFVGDFCSLPRSSGLAPNEGHEKRWHLGMARLLHGRTGRGGMGAGCRQLLPAGVGGDPGTWGLGCRGISGNLSAAARFLKQSERRKGARQS